MPEQPLDLYWKQQLVGRVTDVTRSESPWVCGKVAIVAMSPDLRKALDHLHKQSLTREGVTDWPFSDEFEVDWYVVHPDGSSSEICEPNIDFATGTIKWA